MNHQMKLGQPVSLRQNPYKSVASFSVWIRGIYDVAWYKWYNWSFVFYKYYFKFFGFWPDVVVCLFICLRLQSGHAAEPGLLLPAALLRPRQAGHHRLDAAVPARTPTQPGGSQRPGLTNQEVPSGPRPRPRDQSEGSTRTPRTKGTEYYLLLLWEESRRSTKTAAALWTIWTNGCAAKITHGNTFVGRWKWEEGTRPSPAPFLKKPSEMYFGDFLRVVFMGTSMPIFLYVLLIKRKKESERDTLYM